MAEDSRFAVFDFEEDLFLDPIDIFGHEPIELLKLPPYAIPEPPLLDVASQLPASSCHVEVAAVQETSPLRTPIAPFAPLKEASALRSAVEKDPPPPNENAIEKDAPVPNEDATAPSAPSSMDPSLLISDKLHHCVQTMSSTVEQLQREVLQATRARTILKKAKLQRNIIFKDRDAGSFVNKKPRLFDAARTEAVKRKKNSDLLRLCGTILRQLTQHKWAWPFMQPVDVEGLQLHDYYKIIRRPMDLGTIRIRLEAKDGAGYRNVREFCEDVRLVFRNAMLYNESWTEVHLMAKALLQKFEDRWKVSIEPRLAEEEERLYEDQQDSYLSDIAELHAGEEQAAEQLRTNVLSQLTDVQSKLDSFLMQVLSKCRTMGVEEKKDLYLRLCKLPPNSLTRVVEIVHGKNDQDAATDDVFFDLEVLDSSTLWRLHFFVKMLTDNAEEQVEKPLDSKNDSGGPSNAI